MLERLALESGIGRTVRAEDPRRATGAASPEVARSYIEPAPPGFRGTNARSRPSDGAEKKDPHQAPWCARSSATRPWIWTPASWWCTRTSACTFEKAEREKAIRPRSLPATRGPGPTRRPGQTAQGGAQGRRRRPAASWPAMCDGQRLPLTDWSYEDGVFRYFEHPLELRARARRAQGQVRHFAQLAKGMSLSAVDIVRLYQQPELSC